MKNKKRPVSIIVTLIILVGFSGMYFFRNNNPKTEYETTLVTKDTWRVYDNINLGFSVEIPAMWKVIEYDDSVSFVDESVKPTMTFNVSSFPFKNQSIQTYLNKSNENNGEKSNIVSTMKIKVSGRDAAYREIIDIDGSNDLNTYIPLKDKVYFLGLEQSAKLTQRNRDIFDKILSTFKLID